MLSEMKMPSLLELSYEDRKLFALKQLQTIPEWNDVHSVDDFNMVQNKGEIWQRL